MLSGIDARSRCIPQNVSTSPSDDARRSEQRALEQQMRDDVAARRAERGARGQLAATRDAARELQVGEVGACHEQHGQHRVDQRGVKSAHAKHRVNMNLSADEATQREALVTRRFSDDRGDLMRDTDHGGTQLRDSSCREIESC